MFLKFRSQILKPLSEQNAFISKGDWWELGMQGIALEEIKCEYMQDVCSAEKETVQSAWAFPEGSVFITRQQNMLT